MADGGVLGRNCCNQAISLTTRSPHSSSCLAVNQLPTVALDPACPDFPAPLAIAPIAHSALTCCWLQPNMLVPYA